MRPHTPVHRLDRLEAVIILPTRENAYNASLAVSGRSDTKRGSLWHYAEGFDGATSALKGYGMSDAIAHIVLAAAQDRPRSLEQLNFALAGGLAWDEPQLPF